MFLNKGYFLAWLACQPSSANKSRNANGINHLFVLTLPGAPEINVEVEAKKKLRAVAESCGIIKYHV
jgi:hypothetical protein